MLKWPALVICLCFFLFPDLQAIAKENDWTRLTQYRHRVWRSSEGWFDSTIHRIQQGADGYIWIATESGMLRFDGVRFSAWLAPLGHQPLQHVYFIFASREGAMWIVSDQGLSVYKGSELTDLPLTGGNIESLYQDHTGTVWAVRTKLKKGQLPVCNVSVRPARCYGPNEGLAMLYATEITEDQDGYFWIAGSHLVRWKPGVPQVEYFAEALKAYGNSRGITDLLSLSDGSVLAGLRVDGKNAGLQWWRNGQWQTYKIAGFDGGTSGGETLFQDAEGAIWLSPSGPGLVHIQNGQVDKFLRSDGLSGDSVTNIIQDTEGSVWVATEHGIDSFSQLPVTTYSAGEGMPPHSAVSVAARSDAAVVVGYDRPVSIKDGIVSDLPGVDRIQRQGGIASMLIDGAQSLWLAQGSQLFHYQDGVPKVVKTANGADSLLAGEMFDSMTEDSNHAIWGLISGNHQHRLALVDGQGMREVITLPTEDVAHFVAADRSGGVWVGGNFNHLDYFANGKLTTQDLADAGTGFAVSNMYVDVDDRLWVLSNRGLRVLAAGKSSSVTTENGLPCNFLFSAMIDKDNILWVVAACGLMRIEQREWTTVLNSPNAKINVQLIGSAEGWTLGSARPSGKITQTKDGKLWFSGQDLQVLDPSRLAIKPVDPPIHIEQVVVDRKPYAFEALRRIPPNPREVQIDYSAPSFRNPQQIQFKYRLEGHDEAWQEPGSRRQAFYTDLAPGHYRFQVIAGQAGITSRQHGDSVEFTVAPTFFQTRYFLVLCCLAGVGLLSFAYRIRVRQIQGRLGERLRERERIARELHDTLLQSAQGLILIFQGFAGQLSKPDPTRQRMEAALDHADHLLNEARARVTELRTAGINDDLVQALRLAGRDLFVEGIVKFDLLVTGTERQVSQNAADELFRIGREALTNALIHSAATVVEVEINFEATQLRLLIRDNGRGISAEVQESGGRPQHFGLRGMRERAERIGAAFNLRSANPGGTEIIVITPAANAYAKDTKQHWASVALTRLGLGTRY
jgi:signal transduction histidine kinase/ligand-binding sensor domain-containing protein